MPYPFVSDREMERLKRIAESQKTTVYQIMKAIVKAGLDNIEKNPQRWRNACLKSQEERKRV